MKKKAICAVLIVLAVLTAARCVCINRSYYPMGGEVTVLSKQTGSGRYYLTVEQGGPEDEGRGRFELECTPEQYHSVDAGDVVKCDRTQSAVTHKGTIHTIYGGTS